MCCVSTTPNLQNQVEKRTPVYNLQTNSFILAESEAVLRLSKKVVVNKSDLSIDQATMQQSNSNFTLATTT